MASTNKLQTENGKRKTGDPGVPGVPGVPGGKGGQDYQPRLYAFRKYMVLMV